MQLFTKILQLLLIMLTVKGVKGDVTGREEEGRRKGRERKVVRKWVRGEKKLLESRTSLVALKTYQCSLIGTEALPLYLSSHAGVLEFVLQVSNLLFQSCHLLICPQGFLCILLLHLHVRGICVFEDGGGSLLSVTMENLSGNIVLKFLDFSHFFGGRYLSAANQIAALSSFLGNPKHLSRC